MTQHDDPYEGQHAAPAPLGPSADWPAVPRPVDAGPPPYQPQVPWPSAQPPADYSRAGFPAPLPPQGDTGQWDRVEPQRHAPGPGPQQAPPRPAPPQPAPPGYAQNPQYPPPAANDGYYGPPVQRPAHAPAPAPTRQAPAQQQADPAALVTDDSAWSTANAEKEGPKQGWRGGLAKIGIKLSKSAKEQEFDRDVLRIMRKLAYPQNVPVISLKGGVGKSTSTITLGSTLAKYRHVSDTVAFDSATDGSLRRRMPVEQNRSVTSDARLFLGSVQERAKHEQSLSGSEVKVQLYSNSAGLQALVAAQHLKDYKLDEAEFYQILETLHHEYMVNLIDTSPDRRVPTFWPTIQSAHALVLVTTPNALSVDAAKRFIDLIRASHYQNLLARTVLLWNNAAPGKDVVINVEATQNILVQQLSTRNDPSTCLVEIPEDEHLAAGGEINLKLLRKDTRRQFERAAALLMDKLPDLAVANHELQAGADDKEL